MAPITTTVDVDRPAADVFAYATDPTRFPEWQAGVVGGHMDGTGPARPGTRCSTTRRIGGARRSVTAEVTHVDPPNAWGVRGIDGPVRATVDLTVTPLAEGRSRLTIAVDFEGHGVGRVLVPLLVRPEARRKMPGNLADLKRHLESWTVRPEDGRTV
ncbi:uncharacterized protein YndB with AHSA1/START domain [Amycolatopsis bartoniae]|uniref:SRPBCC family protein n=1 Tax=Amycolatopsis bartoniae TaxID=941986 RepID=A0A8H9ISA3_9PSEU|nr:SRPBCC family protein [Amycolatopsis bartoniae]MBB2937699.1 uncharacterized protein YndB with AHSA1/START domain [Amycolatopsis bartoniae]TVT08212.1 SRPBCC family protein [Amycolatopsis bartoniae]GHF40015.1 hypothetical protein GCM10017566_11740 [Amycolatopsis bartoniae]